MDKEHTLSLEEALTLVQGKLPPLPATTAHPALVMLAGLPGAGKSFFARRLAEILPCLIIESDWVRKVLFPIPDYSPQESMLVHRTCHRLIEKLLCQGVRIIYDATNLVEFQREFVYRIAERAKAKLVIVKTVAPEEVIRERLSRRGEEGVSLDYSDADWAIYQRMASQEEPIHRPHLVVDTGQDLEEGLRKVLRELKRAP